jgi:ornithine cyclodeaminase
VRVWSRTAAHAEAFAGSQSARWGVAIEAVADAEAAVAGADLICTVSAAREPILKGAWIAPGAHLNVVGASQANAAEIDTQAVTRSRYFIDYRPSTLAEAGEYLRAVAAGAITEAHIQAEIGEVASDAKPGRRAPSEITLYKSLGIAAQDLAAAHFLLDAARTAGVGQTVEF